MKAKGDWLKKPVVEMIIIMACGIFLISISLGLIFGIYRPFVPWQKITCDWLYNGDDKSVNAVDVADGKYIYKFTLDGTYYEVPLKVYNTRHSNANTLHIVYVNRNNPYEAKAGHYGTLFLAALLILLTGGVGMVAFAVINYIGKTGNKKKNKIKRKR